jgi:hypothetical protein
MATKQDPTAVDRAVTGRLATAAHGVSLACLIAFELQPLLACAARPEPSRTPAVIVNSTAATAAELKRVIRDAIGDVPVTLADDAFTTSNRLSLEHARPRDPQGRLLNGRELSRPETFELFKRGLVCVLVRSKTGREWTLHHAQCVAAPVQAPQ